MPSASPNPLLPTDSGQVSSSPASPVSQTIATTTTLPQADSSSSKITISSSGSGAGFIQWLVPLGGEPGGGYRVDIFDKTSDLKKTILVPSGSNDVDVSGLENGEYSVIVYANNDGVFEKIDKPVKLEVGDSFWRRLIPFWPYFIIVTAFIVLLNWLRLRKVKNVNIKM